MEDKSRHLSIVDYFEQLQKEYVTTYIRSRIYTKKENKDYYENVLRYKKTKIIDISQRNNLPSIFNSYKEYDKIFGLIVSFGVPNFEYRDGEQVSKMYSRDMNNYFSSGSDIKYKDSSGEIFIGKIESYDFNKQVVKIKLRNGSNTMYTSINNVMRII